MSAETTEIKDRAAAEIVLREIANLTTRRDSQATILARGIETLRSRFAPDITKLENQIHTREDWLKQWATTNPQEFPEKKKFLDLSGHRIGFRINPAKLSLLSRWTWDKVKQAVAEKWPAYIRTVTELDAAKLKADVTCETPIFQPGDLSSVGLKLEQDENFYVKLKPA